MSTEQQAPQTGSAGTGPGPVRLIIPASATLLRLARVTASTLAVDLGFALQDIEDLRVGIDELCAAAIDGCPDDASLELAFATADGLLTVHGAVSDGSSPTPELHPVAREILSLTVDDYAVDPDGPRTFHMHKAPRSADG